MASIAKWWASALWCAVAARALQPENITLERALTEALENNLSLLAQRASIAVAEARLITARLRPNPVLSAGGDHLDLLGTGFDELNAAGPPEFNVRADFTIERGGKRQSRIAVAEHGRRIAELEFLDAVRTLRQEVQNGFLDALLAKEKLALARRNWETFNRLVEINRARWRAGDIAEVELIRSRVAALEQGNAVRRAEAEVRGAIIRLLSLMGRTRFAPEADVEGDLGRDAELPALEAVRQSALERRPDLLAARLSARRATAELKLELARARPDLTLGSEYRRQQGLAGKGNMLGFFIEIPLPVFDRNQGEIERARQELRQAELRVRALEAAILAEVENAHQQCVVSRRLLAEIETGVLAQAREVRDITEYSYTRGQASLLELLDAQRTFNDAFAAWIEARADYARCRYRLEALAALGIRP